MTNRRTTKQLLVSVVLLIVCILMLLGTTFAWFTDNATSPDNKIEAGTLDVEMYWAEGKEDPNTTTAWADASKGPMFNYELWEPGYVAARQIKISNKGTLDFKYKLNIIANGEVTELADVIDVYFIDPAVQLADRAAIPAEKKIGTLTEVLAGLSNGNLGANELGAGKDVYVTIALKMQESAGNEYQDLGIGSSFSIQLLATQVASEKDSFGTDYDKYATYPEASVPEKLPETGSATKEMALETESTKTLLSKDVLKNILDNTDAKSLATAHETPIIDVANKKVSINNFEVVDENGEIVDLKAMNNDKPVTVTVQVGAAFSAGEIVVIYHDDEVVASAAVSAEKTVTYTATHFCDIVVSTGDGKVDSLFELEAALASGGNVKLEENVTLTETLTIPENVFVALDLNGKKISGATSAAILVNNGTLTIVGGTIENTAVNGGATISNKGTLVLDGANVVGAPIGKDSGYPAYCISNSGNLTVEEGTTVSADRGCLYLSGTGETVINGGTFTNNDIYEKLNGRSFTSHVVVVGYGANNKLTINGGSFNHFHTTTSGGVVINNRSAVTVDVNGGNFSGGNYYGKWDNLSDYGYGSTKTPFAVKGGTFTGMDSNYVADGFKAIENNGTYVVVPENVDAVILTAADLQALSAKYFTENNSVAESYTIMLGANIDMNGADFSAIIAQRGDTLTFIGNGHIISNVNIISGADDNTTGQASMFYVYPNSTLNVSDLILKDITVTADANSTGYAAAVIGCCEGTAILNNVDVVNATIVGAKSSGALAGHVGNGGNITATNCDVSATVTLSSYEANGHYAGKYLGTMAGDITLNKCTADVTVSGNLNANNIGDIYGRKVSGNLTIDGKTVTSNAADVVNGGNFVLSGNVQNNSAIKNDTSIDLNGNTFEATSGFELSNNADFTMMNGSFVVNNFSGYVDARPDSAEGSVLTFENVNFTSNYMNKTFGNSTDRLSSVVEICPAAAGGHVVAVFRNCTFNNAKVLIEGMSGKTGTFEAIFENCTFNALTNSSPIEVVNYMEGTITVKNCTFNLECTSGVASAIDISPSSSTKVTVVAENNIFNATAATPSGENGTVEQIKVNGTPANIKFISAYDNATVTETGTVKSGIAK